MLYTLTGKVTAIAETFFVVDCGGVGYQVFASGKTLGSLPQGGETVTVYCRLFMREPNLEVYGFLEEGALKLFELLNTVAGVGPKTALGVLDLDSVPNVMAAILEKRVDLLTRASGIGKKTAERIILELESRVKLSGAATRTAAMDRNREVEEALVGLGYPANAVRAVIAGLPKGELSIEECLREALRRLAPGRH